MADHEARPQFSVRLLGPWQVLRDDSAVHVGGRLPRRLLAALAARPGGIGVGRLVEEVWGADLPDGAESTLPSYVSRLRGALDPDRTVEGGVVQRTSDGYRLALPEEAVDLLRFRALAGARHDPAPRTTVLQEALSLWTAGWEPGDDLPPLVRADLAEAAEERDAVEEELIRLTLEDGGHLEALPALERLARARPERESAASLLATSLYRAGRQSDALDVVRRCRAHLAEELGLLPGPVLEQVEEQILRHDPVLGTPRAAGDRPATTPNPAGPVPAVVTQPRRPPVPLTRLVGRADALGELETRLASARLVTLVGPGGTGKTRLALEIASGRPGRQLGHAVWVPLAELTEPEQVPGAVARALGVPDESEDLGRLVSTIDAIGAVLLVIDNAEHVLPSVAALLHGVLSGAAQARAVVTSRVALGIPGEEIVDLPPLSLEAGNGWSSAAEVLFVERARAVLSQWQPDATESAAVREICRRLDGLPLALELAAARVRHLDVATVLAGLDGGDHLAATPGGPGTRSLESTVSWSVDLLDEPHRRALLRLSVLDSSFTTALGARVGGCDEHAVAELARHSLLVTETTRSPRRHRMLHVVREWAAGRLEDHDRVAGLEELSAWAAELASSVSVDILDTDRAPHLLREVDRDLPHVELAVRSGGRDPIRTLRTVAALGPAWIARRPRQGLAALESALAAAPTDTDEAVLAEACYQVSALSWLVHDGERGLSAADQARHHASAAGLVAVEAVTIAFAAYFALYGGQADDALALAEQAVALAEAAPGADRDLTVAKCLIVLGVVHEAAGRLDEALVHLRRSGHMLVQSRDWPARLGGRIDLYRVCVAAGAPEQVVREAPDDVLLSAEIGSDFTLVAYLDLLALGWAVTGRAHAAARLLGAVRRLEGQLGMPPDSVTRGFAEWGAPAVEQSVRTALGDAGWHDALAEGAVMDRETVVALATSARVEESPQTEPARRLRVVR